MPKLYIIENERNKGCWLYRVERDGRNKLESQVNHYGPQVENAAVFRRKEEAVQFARRWGGCVWQTRMGVPEKIIWPEET